jgi:hypothetical protein
MTIGSRQWIINSADAPTSILPDQPLGGKKATDNIGGNGFTATIAPTGSVDIKVAQIEFANYLNALDTLIVQNALGQTIWEAHGEADLKTLRSGHIGWVRGGVQIPRLDTGNAFIYTE